MSKNYFTIEAIFYNSLLKRNYSANNKKNTNTVLPIASVGWGGGSGGNNQFILFIMLAISLHIIYDNFNKKIVANF